MPWALIDPNWGDPKPVLGTIRDSEDGAWAAAISPRADPNCRLYSGASEHPYPSGTPGQMNILKMHGFTVQKVGVEIQSEVSTMEADR